MKPILCPMCEESCADERALAAHLGDVHDLHDDEGASTISDGEPVDDPAAGEADPTVVAAAGAGDLVLGIDGEPETIDGIPVSRIYDPRADDARWRPVVLVTLALLLLGGVALASFLGGGSGDTDASQEAAASDSTVPPGGETAAVEAVGPIEATPTTVAPPGPSDAAPPDAAPAPATSPTTSPARPTATTTPPRPASPPPPPTTAPPPPPPPTTAPPAYVAPQATDARIDGCDRNGNDATWTFSYVLSGGTGWRPSPAASASGGRLFETRSGLARNGFGVAAVEVVDDAGVRHAVALQPALAADHCR